MTGASSDWKTIFGRDGFDVIGGTDWQNASTSEFIFPSPVFEEENSILTKLPSENLFSIGTYLQQNSDALSTGDPFEHMLNRGVPENRVIPIFGHDRGLDLFREKEYLSANPDVAQAVNNGIFASGLDHYLTFGINETRELSLSAPDVFQDFNPDFYLATYPDVAEAVKNGVINAFDHFALFGQFEGRFGSADGYVSSWKQLPPDYKGPVQNTDGTIKGSQARFKNAQEAIAFVRANLDTAKPEDLIEALRVIAASPFGTVREAEQILAEGYSKVPLSPEFIQHRREIVTGAVKDYIDRNPVEPIEASWQGLTNVQKAGIIQSYVNELATLLGIAPPRIRLQEPPEGMQPSGAYDGNTHTVIFFTGPGASLDLGWRESLITATHELASHAKDIFELKGLAPLNERFPRDYALLMVNNLPSGMVTSRVSYEAYLEQPIEKLAFSIDDTLRDMLKLPRLPGR